MVRGDELIAVAYIEEYSMISIYSLVRAIVEVMVI
jgi:hypothetical protein